MLLVFSKEQFEQRIIQGIKRFSIREDKHNRWKAGMKIDFWRGNPRNVNAKVKPYCFGTGVVKEVVQVLLESNQITMYVSSPSPNNNSIIETYESTIPYKHPQDQFAKSDGFDSYEEMKQFFTLPFKGKLILWEDFQPVNKNV